MSQPNVVVFDYGSGNLRSAQRALERAGATVAVTADHRAAREADGLVVPGVGAFAACMAAITAVGGGEVIAARIAQEAPVLGICVGAQVLFDCGEEHGVITRGLELLPGAVTRLAAERIPHMGWNTVEHDGMALFAGIAPHERFYFVHSYAARPPVADAEVATCIHGGPFVAAVARGPLSATQFHPEKSGKAGLALLTNWVRSL